MTDEQIKHMVDRFLGWRLPENFTPDAGISFERTYNEHTPYPMKHEPIGTNLFDAQQAEQMVRYMIEGLCRPAEDGLAGEPVAQLEVRNGIAGLKHLLAPIDHVSDGMMLYRSPPLEPFERLVEKWHKYG